VRYYHWKSKDAWVSSRKIGDKVCDGNGKHRSISNIQAYKDYPRWIITFGMWLNNFAEKRWGQPTAQNIEFKWLDMAERLGLSELHTDIDFEFGDGWTFNGFDSCNEPQQDGSCHAGME
jgi:hypothetical protein